MDSKFRNIDSLEDLDGLFDLSAQKPVILFKHSNSCGTSAYIHEIITDVPGTIHRVTVQERRDISNAITQRTGVIHHTPQLFVLKNGEAVYSASHYGITPEAVAKALA